MYDYLKGILTHAEKNRLTLEVGGIGFSLFLPANALSLLPAVGSPLMLYVAEVIKEDSWTLYGFLTAKERALFFKLNDINGIGPKMALNILGNLSKRELYEALHHQRPDLVAKVPGVGKKTAQRLIMELDLAQIADLLEEDSQSPSSSLLIDAIQALLRLGYPRGSCEQAVQRAHCRLPSSTLEELIKLSLSFLRANTL